MLLLLLILLLIMTFSSALMLPGGRQEGGIRPVESPALLQNVHFFGYQKIKKKIR